MLVSIAISIWGCSLSDPRTGNRLLHLFIKLSPRWGTLLDFFVVKNYIANTETLKKNIEH